MAENQYDFGNVSDETLQKAIRMLSYVSREWLDMFNGANGASFFDFSFMVNDVRVEKLYDNYTDLPDSLLIRRNDIVAEFYQKMCECAVYERSVLENELQNRIEARRLN